MRSLLFLSGLLFSLMSQASEFSSYDQMSNFRYPNARFCAYRADLWVEELKHSHDVSDVRKILVIFSPHFSQSFGEMPWYWHIAPLVKMDSRELVFEKANHIQSPLTPNQWFKQFSHHDLAECGTFEEYREEMIAAYDHPGLANSVLDFKRLISKPCYYGPVPAGVEDPHLPVLYAYLKDGTIPPPLNRAVLQTDCETMNGLQGSQFMYQANLSAEHVLPRIGFIETKIRKHCQQYLDKLLGKE